MLDLKSELSIVHLHSGEYGKAMGEARRNGNTPDPIKACFQLALHREDVEGRARPFLERASYTISTGRSGV